MANELAVFDEGTIKNRIHTLRGVHVIIDRDLAELYGVTTKVLNQSVKRNSKRFPESFMFQLTNSEYNSLRSQIVTLEKGRGTHRKYLPYAFTEQGIAMLSGVLKSKTAINVSIQIMNAFVAMRKFIASNAQVFYRLGHVERKQIEHDRKFEQVFDAIQSKGIKPEKGIFFEGQIFDAHRFVSDIIRSASSSIMLVDNFVDDSVLTLFCKRRDNVAVTIFTREISRQLSLDLARYNSQYPSIEIKEFKHSHDRFMIIDNREVYHIGASLKDLGKKWFAFSKFDKDAFGIMARLA
jgi:hypothetical protein